MSDVWSFWNQQRLKDLASHNLLRVKRVTEPKDGGLYFSANDYLGLSDHETVREASIRCWQEEGAGVRASALISGRSSHHKLLEENLAILKSAESSLLFPSGYAANVGLLSALADDDLAIFSDAENHASLIDGCRLARQSGAIVSVYPHLDYSALEQKLEQSSSKRKLIVSDSVFSMTGELLDLERLVEISKRYQAQICLDEAHATLVLGKKGGGVAESLGLSHHVLFQTGTLSKAFGLLGGFVASTSSMIELLFNRSRSQVFSTALPAPIAAAANVAIPFGKSGSEPRKALLRNMNFFSQLIDQDIGAPIVTINLGSAEKAVSVSHGLAQCGIFVPAIRPPTVPEDSSRLRISMSARHSTDDLTRLASALKDAAVL